MHVLFSQMIDNSKIGRRIAERKLLAGKKITGRLKNKEKKTTGRKKNSIFSGKNCRKVITTY